MSGPSFATSPVIYVITHLVDRNFGKGRTILDFQEVSNALLNVTSETADGGSISYGYTP